VSFTKQDRTVRSHAYIAPIGGGEERQDLVDALLGFGHLPAPPPVVGVGVRRDS
jgi:hypothetical protein